MRIDDRSSRRAVAAVLLGATTIGVSAVAAPAEAQVPPDLPGEASITVPINDSEAGGTYDQDFTLRLQQHHP